MKSDKRSPTPALPKREGDPNIWLTAPSLWGRAGVGLILCLILCGCITEFELKGINEIEGILVVEGIITDDESVITLSRSKGLSYEDDLRDLSPYHVTDAKVYIECDDGKQWDVTSQNSGKYTIANGKLNPERQYRIKIESDEQVYASDFAYPLVPPEIDSVFWTKKESGQPVNIHVSTHAPDSTARYYRWSYIDVWVFRSNIKYNSDICGRCNIYVSHATNFCPICGIRVRYPHYCWSSTSNTELLIGSTEKTGFGNVTEIIAEINPMDRKLSLLYRIEVMQYAISKRAFDYYTNIKKNAQQTGSLFAHIPAEIKGNISCITDPRRPVIGYMDVSTAVASKKLYLKPDVYEFSILQRECFPPVLYYPIPPEYIIVPGAGVFYPECVDCELDGGNPIFYLPDDWPYHYE